MTADAPHETLQNSAAFGTAAGRFSLHALDDTINAKAELRALQCSRDRQKQGCF